MPTLAQLFQQGYAMGQTQAQKDRALAAAERQYGAKADNPGLFAALQNQDVQYNQDQRATARMQSDLTTAAQNRDLAYNRDQRAMATTQSSLASAGQQRDIIGQQQRARMSLAATNAMARAKATGGDVGTVFDATIGKNPQAYGVDPNQVKAMRDKFVSDPNFLSQSQAYWADLVPTKGKKGASTAKADAANADAAAIAGDTIMSATQRAMDAANNRSLPAAMSGAASYLPWSPSAEVYRQIKVLQSQATLQNLKAMRAQSATGASGMGQLSNAEGEKLVAAAGALDPKSPTFERDLRDYARNLLETIHGKAAGDKIFAERFGGGGPGDVGKPQLPAGVTPDQAYSDAKDALAQGADAATIKKRLQEMNLDPAQVGL